MNELLSKVYILSFLIGPSYFFIIFLVSQFVGTDLGDSTDEIDIGDDLVDFETEEIAIDEINEIEFDDSEVDDLNVSDSTVFKVNYFSPKIWAVIICGFGFGGYSALEVLKKEGITSLIFGSMTGLFIGTILFGILSYLYSNSSINDIPIKLEGRKGTVTLSIPYRKTGLVRIDFLSGNQEFRANSVHRRKIKKGEEVKILKYDTEKHLLIVRENK